MKEIKISIGQKFGMLEVIGYGDDLITSKGYVYKRYLCRCKCGREKLFTKRSLTTDKTQSCGCLVGRKFRDISGMQFGRLKAISVNRIVKNRCYWNCDCECGNKTVVRSSSLLSGDTKSCGCLRAEILLHETYETHGMTETRLYRIWMGMKRRCKNKNLREYNRYGGRGITVCQEWLDDFMNFYNWAMANGYRDDLTLDRKDNDKGYFPNNCRWSTVKEQANNRSNNVLLFFNNELKTISEWGEELGIKDGTIRARLKRGWSVEKSLSLIPADSEVEVSE